LAYNELGHMYMNGEHVPQDFAEAKRLFQLAVDNGNAMAMVNLRLCGPKDVCRKTSSKGESGEN